MVPHAERTPKLGFGPFEYDPASGELRKYGVQVKLPAQPRQVLEALLGRPGELVSREDLRNLLWPGVTAGDFEHGLNAAVNKLRQALGDSGDQPRYVETVAGRRGYRFVAPVQCDPVTAPVLEMPAPAAALRIEPNPRTPSARLAVGAIALIAIAGGVYSFRSRSPALAIPDVVRFCPSPCRIRSGRRGQPAVARALARRHEISLHGDGCKRSIQSVHARFQVT